MSIRARVIILLALIVLYPLVGIMFIKENEKSTRKLDASYLKDRLEDIAKLITFNLAPEEPGNPPATITQRAIFLSPLEMTPVIDGHPDEAWTRLPKHTLADASNELTLSWRAGLIEEKIYLLFTVNDNTFHPHNYQRSLLANGDHMGIRLGDNRTYYLRLSRPGQITPYYLNSVDNQINSNAIKAFWSRTDEGYQVELKIDEKEASERLGFFVVNSAIKYKTRIEPSSIVANLSTIERQDGVHRIIDTNMAPRFQSYSFTLASTLDHIVSDGMRLHVVNSECHVVATAGEFHIDESGQSVPEYMKRLYRIILANDTSERYDRESIFNCSQLLNNKKREEIFSQKGVSFWSREYRNDLMSYAAMPLSEGPYTGNILIAEQGRDRYVLLTNPVFLNYTIYLVGISALIVSISIVYLLWWSRRLTTLNKNARQHVDDKGDVSEGFIADESRDEIGQLSRSVGDLLEQIRSHNEYLKTLAQKLSHEMRTPLAIVSTSLDNIDSRSDGDSATNNEVYLNRARDGISRLSQIMNAMGQAKQIEQAIENAQFDSVDIVALLSEACKSYQSVYAKHNVVFESTENATPFTIKASADLLIQLLDKLVDNAIGFSPAGSPVKVKLNIGNKELEIEVINYGSRLPDSDTEGLFQQLVSYRSKSSDKPHLGLGLYVARLIAEYHNGTIVARNFDGGDGVCFTVTIPIT